ncbi:MAG: preprotein translocase subunit SecY [Brevinematales bacterium]|nr:preprotein translocase subunit SecY [Brevinematales bacterium]
MLKAFINIFKVESLRKRVLFTLFILIVFRVGTTIPVPGIDYSVLALYSERFGQTNLGILEFFNLFAGGALSNISIFALGVMPYISALIIIQLLVYVIPALEKISKEPDGRRKIMQYARIGTVPLALIEAWGLSLYFVRNLKAEIFARTGLSLYPDTVLFYLSFLITVTAGTMFLVWMGEQITEKGIGNGISLIIMAGIVARIPESIYNVYRQLQASGTVEITLILVVLLFLGVIIFVVWFEQSVRKIPVSYAKRVVGRKVYGGQSTYIPFKLNPAGVVAIIFASAVMTFPQQVLTFFGGADSPIVRTIAAWLSFEGWLYITLYMLLVIFFSYFYTFIQFNPQELAETLQKNGGFIPGIRAGDPTYRFLNDTLNRILVPGSIIVGLIAILPNIIYGSLNVPTYIAYLLGGTSLLIMVGVALDTLTQIESQLIVHHYDGFLKKGKIRGRGTRYV